MSPRPPDLDPDADVDPGDGRSETTNQRYDRNWVELLQELRVTQTGTQILTGFLLAIAFQPAFATLAAYQRRIYLVVVLTAVLTTALALAPVSLHRGLFRQHAKREVVQLGHLLLRLVLLGVGLVLTGTVLLVVSVVSGPTPAILVAGSLSLVLAFLALLPVVVRAWAARRNNA